MVSKYRKKPVVVDAEKWMANGDHPKVRAWDSVVGLAETCPQCNHDFLNHGKIDTLEGSHIVCPGDWIIRGVKGEYYPCKPDIFTATYEKVEAAT